MLGRGGGNRPSPPEGQAVEAAAPSSAGALEQQGGASACCSHAAGRTWYLGACEFCGCLRILPNITQQLTRTRLRMRARARAFAGPGGSAGHASPADEEAERRRQFVRAREKQLLASVGVVGCGEIAESYLPCLAACGGQVARVFDPDEARAAAITAPGGAAEGAIRCATVDELLACTEVEIVLNLTPVQHHARVSRAALLAGKHVWSEKPLAETQQDARELVSLARDRSLELGCSPLSFWGEAQQTLAHHLRARALGEVRLAQVELLCGAHAPADWNQNDALAFNLGGWAQHGRMGVGSMVDVGIYALALLTALLGPVARVSVVAAKRAQRTGTAQQGAPTAGAERQIDPHNASRIDPHNAPRIDLYNATLIMRSGAVAHVCSSFSLPSGARKRSLSISGDKGTLTLGDIFNFNTCLSYDGVAAADASERGTEGHVRAPGPGGGPLKKGLIYPWRPPYVRAAKHAHVTDWARGLVLLARSVAANEYGCTGRGAESALRTSRETAFKAEGASAHSAGRVVGGDGERARARAFTGDHAAHLVEVLDAIVSASNVQGERAQGETAGRPGEHLEHRGDGEIGVKVVDIVSSFEPLPMLPPHIVPKQNLAGLARVGAEGGGVQAPLTVEASRIVFGTMVLAETKVADPWALLDAAWALGINWYVARQAARIAGAAICWPAKVLLPRGARALWHRQSTRVMCQPRAHAHSCDRRPRPQP